jgi:protoporphyrinogen oxidase
MALKAQAPGSTKNSFSNNPVEDTPLTPRGGRKFVVLGGGVAGLVAARELLRRGCSVTLIERAPVVGGLARTFERDGFKFDIGGHRFHSNNPSVVQWLKDLMKDDLLTVPRTSYIYINKQFVDYPIQFPGALKIFSPLKAVQMLGSYIAAKVNDSKRPEVSFEDWVVKRYGRKLYEVFFEPYTEKVWGIPCRELSATWASQRIGIPSMWRAIKHAIAPPKVAHATAISSFYYPRSGFGMIPETLRQEIEDMGGTIHTGASLQSCTPTKHEGFNIVFEKSDKSIESVECNHLVSTIPLNALLGAIPEELGSAEVLAKYELEYRDIICLFIALNKKQVSEDSWTYFPLKHLTFGRTHEPKNWSKEMVPNDNFTSLCVEIFSSRGEPIWNMSDEGILDRVISEMNDVGWINKSEVHKSWVLRVPYAYPVYRIGYQQKLRAVRNYLAQWRNIHLVGRTGAFTYMNSDGVIEDVFRFLEEVFRAEQEAGLEVTPMATDDGRWL